MTSPNVVSELRTAGQMTQAFRRGDVSPVDVVDDHLARIERLDAHLNAFVLVDRDGARAAAVESDRRWRGGTPLSELDGVQYLYVEGAGSFEFERTASRLREMQSADWATE